MKLVRLIICVFIVSALFIYFATALSEDGSFGELENDSVVVAVGRLQGISEEGDFDYLAQTWKNLLVKHPSVSKIDGFFKQTGLVFSVLFARPYELSLTLFVVMFLWIVTFLALPAYFIFFKDAWARYVLSFGLTVGLAHIRLFSFLATSLVSLTFLRTEWWWELLATIFIFLGVFIYFFLHKYFGAMARTQERKNNQSAAEHSQKKIQAFEKGFEEADINPLNRQ
jgi:hypothetical protein